MSSNPQSFEYELWRLLGGQQISRPLQTRLGNQILALVRTHLGFDPTYDSAPKTAGKYAKGNSVHYFRGILAANSACGRIARSRLKPERITYNPMEASCTHCRASAGLAPVPGAQNVGKTRKELAQADTDL